MSTSRQRMPQPPLDRRALLRLGVRIGTVGALATSVPLLFRSGARGAHANVSPTLPDATAEAVRAPSSGPIVPESPSAPAAPDPAPPPRSLDVAPPAASPFTPPQPSTQAQPAREVNARAITRVSTTKPQVALTVDDGWSRRTEIMRLLSDLNVPAVFFLTAQAVARDEAFLQAAVRNGFEIGNHTTTHRNLSGLSSSDIANELAGMDRVYERAVGSGQPMRFFRAPYGALSGNVLDATDARSYRAIQWDVSTRDWTTLDTEGIARSVVSSARPGSIILSHFNSRCLDALPRLIAGVRANGLEFVALSTFVANVAAPRDIGSR